MSSDLSTVIGLSLFLALLFAWAQWLPAWQSLAAKPSRQSSGRARFTPEAEARADHLLTAVLSAGELAQLVHRGYLETPSRLYPNRVYRIPRRAGRVRLYEQGKPIVELCVQPREPLPAGDLVVFHKLLLEADEATYLRQANRFSCFDGRPLR